VRFQSGSRSRPQSLVRFRSGLGPIPVGAGRRSLGELHPTPGGGDRHSRRAACLRDRAVGSVRRPAHLELDQPGAAKGRALIPAGVGRCRLECGLGRLLSSAAETEHALGRRGPSVGQRNLRAVELADRDTAAVTGPFPGRCGDGVLLPERLGEIQQPLGAKPAHGGNGTSRGGESAPPDSSTVSAGGPAGAGIFRRDLTQVGTSQCRLFGSV
jgi:hypothetical protein